MSGGGCLGGSGPARCACTAGMMACPRLYPPHSLLAPILTPKLGRRCPPPSLSCTLAAWGCLLGARVPSRMDLTIFSFPLLSASFSTKKKPQGSWLGPAAGCLCPRSLLPAPSPEGLEQPGTSPDSLCRESRRHDGGVGVFQPPRSASAFLTHPGRREPDTGRSRRERFPGGKQHAGQRRPPWCVVAAGDGAARGDNLGRPTVMGERAPGIGSPVAYVVSWWLLMPRCHCGLTPTS